MKPEEKQLLLKDICARLPYGVKIQIAGINETLYEIDNPFVNHSDFQVDEVKPYLRPMSSMTEEEKEYAESLSEFHCTPDVARDKIDFYLENHIDFRGLIKKGLALEAPEEMYKTE